jgi:hypothetical protein
MEFIDAIKVPEGIFQLRSYDARTGQLIDFVEGTNIVVNFGREALARLLGAHDPSVAPLPDGDFTGVASWHVDTMKFGNGGHNPVDVTEMLAVSVTDDDLYAANPLQVFEAPTTASWTSFGSRKVTFTASMEIDEGNSPTDLVDPYEYSEAGLYFSGGSMMFAHKAFGYVVKNSTIKLVATWTFTF